MPKREEEDPRGRKKPTKGNGEAQHAAPETPAERATSPPIAIEGTHGTAPSPTASISSSATVATPATASSRDSLMTTPISSISSTTTRAIRADGRASRRRDVLSVQPPPETPDGFVARSIIALAQTAGGDQKVRDVNDLLLAEGLTEEVGKATNRLNLGGLNRTQRLLLSIAPVYASIIESAALPVLYSTGTGSTGGVGTSGGIGAAGGLGTSSGTSGSASAIGPTRRRVDFADTEGLVDYIVRALDAAGGFREKYATSLVDAVIAARGLSVTSVVKQAVVSDVALADLPIPSARVDEVVFSYITKRRSTLDLESAVDIFAASGEIDPVRFTPAVRRAMVGFLRDLGVVFPVGGPTPTDRARFDEYFALAYNNALRVGDGSTTDPIDAVRQKGLVAEWDFTVDTFETVEEQGVVPANILAAGALDYVYNLGERLGMFKLADALVLRWASGAFDAEPGTPSADLYRYWKLRSERISPEERAMMYRRILSKGDGNLLSGMVENEAFPTLWGTLMEKATDYIRRSEENASIDRTVSRHPIFQATKQVQFNLTEAATGMAHMQITEMYHHLIEAKTVLEHAIAYFSTGSRKSLWTVIERASREWFDEAPNISAIRSSAIDGNRVFQWIANFDQAGVTDDQFQGFLDASEAWILSQASDDSEPIGSTNGDGEELDDSTDSFDDDWDK